MAEEKEQTKYRRSNGTTTSTKKLKRIKNYPCNINCFDFTCELDCLYYSELSKWN